MSRLITFLSFFLCVITQYVFAEPYDCGLEQDAYIQCLAANPASGEESTSREVDNAACTDCSAAILALAGVPTCAKIQDVICNDYAPCASTCLELGPCPQEQTDLSVCIVAHGTGTDCARFECDGSSVPEEEGGQQSDQEGGDGNKDSQNNNDNDNDSGNKGLGDSSSAGTYRLFSLFAAAAWFPVVMMM